jgi:hypothetical protein
MHPGGVGGFFPGGKAKQTCIYKADRALIEDKADNQGPGA